MKKNLFVGIVTAMSALSLFVGQSAQADQTIYRLYNKQNGEHLYTTDKNEKDVLFTQHGWGYEGEAWYAPDPGQGSPVYRLYNAGLQNHLYTTDTNEVKVLTSKHGWTLDNNEQPVFYSGGSAKIYRVYNQALRGLHHWTTDENEYTVLPRYGWQQEGVKLYGNRVGVPIQTQYYNHSSISSQPTPSSQTTDSAQASQPAQENNQLSSSVPSGSATIANTDSNHTIEADVALTGSGTGYHAKLVMAAPDAAVSFGLQFDTAAVAPYTGKTAFLIENIGSNNVGGQYYHRANYLASLNTTYRLMLTLQKDGSYVGYVNGTEVVRGRNAVLAGRSDIYLRVEGAARKTGDSITAHFSAIKLKQHGIYSERRWPATPQFNIANGIITKIDDVQVRSTASDTRTINNNVVFTGTLTGLPQHADWDTAGYYDKVSGLVQFIY
ncbi:TPA: hypothetical protein U2D41_000482 [Streptococcus suis]|nr:hypothetical protein [Streptococcus suis]HEM6435571.1 hypothetical protein [Streptococcus suis]